MLQKARGGPTISLAPDLRSRLQERCSHGVKICISGIRAHSGMIIRLWRLQGSFIGKRLVGSVNPTMFHSAHSTMLLGIWRRLCCAAHPSQWCICLEVSSGPSPSARATVL